jgi:hypothetical protein
VLVIVAAEGFCEVDERDLGREEEAAFVCLEGAEADVGEAALDNAGEEVGRLVGGDELEEPGEGVEAELGIATAVGLAGGAVVVLGEGAEADGELEKGIAEEVRGQLGNLVQGAGAVGEDKVVGVELGFVGRDWVAS